MIDSAVIGAGGAGRNALSLLRSSGIPLYMMNEVQDSAYHRIFSTKEDIMAAISTDPNIKRPLTETEKSALHVLSSHDIVFSLSGMGGFYGTLSPALLCSLSSNVIPMFSMPFSVEGGARRLQAEKGAKLVLSRAKWAVVLENDRLLEMAPNATLAGAFHAVNRMFYETATRLSSVLSASSVEKLKKALRGKVGVGIGEGKGMNRGEKALLDALSSPWIDAEGNKIVLVEGGREDDFEIALETLEKKGGKPVISVHSGGGDIIEVLIIG